jgi:hypothetical protein
MKALLAKIGSKVMMVVGVEEPLQANPMLYALDDATGKKVLSHCTNDKLNRYSFVWTGSAHEATERFAALLTLLGQKIPGHGAWVSAWTIPRNFESWITATRWVINSSKSDQRIAKGRKMWEEDKTRSENLVNSRRQMGWKLCEKQELVIALKNVDLETVTSFTSSDYSYTDKGGIVLMAGSNISCEVFLQAEPQQTLSWMGQRKSIYPSQNFLAWLVEKQFTLFYEASDDAGRPGIIVITPFCLPIDFAQNQSIVQEAIFGNEASRVWRYHKSSL